MIPERPWNIPAHAHADTEDQIAKDAEQYKSQYDDGWEFDMPDEDEQDDDEPKT